LKTAGIFHITVQIGLHAIAKRCRRMEDCSLLRQSRRPRAASSCSIYCGPIAYRSVAVHHLHVLTARRHNIKN